MEQLERCKSLYMELKDKVNQLEGAKTALSKQFNTKKREKTALDNVITLDNQCIEVFKSLGDTVQKKVISSIEAFVTRIYQYVFETPDRFRIKYSIKRNVPNMSFVIVSGSTEYDPIDSLGGGVVDVLSFALRLGGLLLIRPKMRHVLILDEPFKHLSIKYRPRMVELLDTVCKECGVQIIMTTHQQEFMQSGHVFEVTKEGDVSQCVEKS